MGSIRWYVEYLFIDISTVYPMPSLNIPAISFKLEKGNFEL